MPRAPSLLSDDFLRHLMAVGHVDVLVGLPTFNNAETVGSIAKAVHVAFAQHFPRYRTVLLNSDGGSNDGTPEIVRNVTLEASEDPVAAQMLRTVHRISTPHAGSLGKGSALRSFFAAADLLQARAVAVIDPDTTSITPEWIARLVRPVLDQAIDYVGPVYARHRFEGLLVSQIARPLFQAAYAVTMHEPVGGEFGCSGRFAAHCFGQTVWDLDFTRYGMDIWLAGEAVAKGFNVGEAALGARMPGHVSAQPPTGELVEYVVGSLFTCLQLHESYWVNARDMRELPVYGALDVPSTDGDVPEVTTLAEGYAGAVRDLGPILSQVLTPETLAGIQGAPGAEFPGLSDELWAHVLGEFAGSHARHGLGSHHLLKALVPLYLGRLAWFVETHRDADVAAVDAANERLNAACLRSKTYWIERWGG